MATTEDSCGKMLDYGAERKWDLLNVPRMPTVLFAVSSVLLIISHLHWYRLMSCWLPFFSKEAVLEPFRTTTIVTRFGPDSLFSSVLWHKDVALVVEFTPLINTLWSMSCIADCRRVFRAGPIPKSNDSATLSEHFRPLPLTSSGFQNDSFLCLNTFVLLRIRLTIPHK